jgi:putative transposase
MHMWGRILLSVAVDVVRVQFRNAKSKAMDRSVRPTHGQPYAQAPSQSEVRIPPEAAALSEARTSVVRNILQGQPKSFSPEARDAVLRHCLHDHGRRFQLHAAVVMPDHVHLLLTPLPDEEGWPYGLPSILKLLKGTSARSVNKLTGSCGPVWQEESLDHVLRCQESLEEKLEYIRQNPVRRGLAKKPEDYPWLWAEEPMCGADTLVRRI